MVFQHLFAHQNILVYLAFILTKSTTPTKVSSFQLAIVLNQFALICLLSCHCSKKSAPTMSILLMKANLGTLYLSACLQIVSDWALLLMQNNALHRLGSLGPFYFYCEVHMAWCVDNVYPMVSPHTGSGGGGIVIPLSCSSFHQSIWAAPMSLSYFVYLTSVKQIFCGGCLSCINMSHYAIFLVFSNAIFLGTIFPPSS